VIAAEPIAAHRKRSQTASSIKAYRFPLLTTACCCSYALAPLYTLLQQRVLAQVVTPGSPTYVYDACLRTDDLDFADSRPYVGVAASAGGYTMVEVSACLVLCFVGIHAHV
jgi:hypothetical protein